MGLKMKTLCLAGFMGSGKSSVGKCLARMLDARFDDLDDLVVETSGKGIRELFAEGEEYFRRAEHEALRTYLESGSASPRVLALGGGTLCWRPSRDILFSSADVVTVYLRASLQTILERVGSSDPSRPLYSRARTLYAERQTLYAMAPFAVETDGKDVMEVAAEIRDMLFA